MDLDADGLADADGEADGVDGTDTGEEGLDLGLCFGGEGMLARCVVVCTGGGVEGDAEADADAVTEGVDPSNRLAALELSVGDALDVGNPPVEFAAGVSAGACEPSIT